MFSVSVNPLQVRKYQVMQRSNVSNPYRSNCRRFCRRCPVSVRRSTGTRRGSRSSNSSNSSLIEGRQRRRPQRRKWASCAPNLSRPLWPPPPQSPRRSRRSSETPSPPPRGTMNLSRRRPPAPSRARSGPAAAVTRRTRPSRRTRESRRRRWQSRPRRRPAFSSLRGCS